MRYMQDTPQWRMEWLRIHKTAQAIVTTVDGVPVRAEYRTISGSYPVAYSYPSNEGFNL